MSRATNTWTGFKGRIGGWFLAGPFRRFADLVFDGDVLGKLRQELALRGSEQLVELGCGSGYVTVPIARQLNTGRLCCVDLSAEMLKLLERRLQRRGLADRTKLIEADVTDVPLPDAQADGVFTAGLLHELPHPEGVLHEAFRLLRPGGRLVIADFHYVEFMWRRMRHSHHPDAHGPYTLPQIERALAEAGFSNPQARRSRMWLIASGFRAG